jgi:uncharacterized protein (TIGR02001 family)
VTFISDYVSRGISQTDNGPAAQGSLDLAYAVDERFVPYAAIWASNVEFGTPPGLDRASALVDLTAGARGSQPLWDGYALSYGANFDYYKYLNASDQLNYDYVEFGATSGIRTPFGSVGVGLQWSPSYFANSGDGYYLNGNVNVPLPIDLPIPLSLSIIGNYGRLWVQKNNVFGLPDYNKWQAGLSATYEPHALAFTVVYIDTDIEKIDCVGGRDICDSRIVVGATKTF